jgi:hypothetical protein
VPCEQPEQEQRREPGAGGGVGLEAERLRQPRGRERRLLDVREARVVLVEQPLPVESEVLRVLAQEGTRVRSAGEASKRSLSSAAR